MYRIGVRKTAVGPDAFEIYADDSIGTVIASAMVDGAAELIERVIRPLGAVLVERANQIRQGHTPSADDDCTNDEIAALATWYAMPPGARDWATESTGYGDTLGEAILPQGYEQPRERTRTEELAIAAALIFAELERLARVKG